MSTADFLKLDQAEATRCADLFQRIQIYERQHPVLLKVRSVYSTHCVRHAATGCRADKLRATGQTRPVNEALRPCCSMHISAGGEAAALSVLCMPHAEQCDGVRLGGMPQVLHERAVAYLGARKALVSQVIGTAGALGLGQEVVHTAVAQMDRVMASGALMTDSFQAVFVCACLRLAAMQEGGFIPASAAVAGFIAVPGAPGPQAACALGAGCLSKAV